MNIYPEKSGKVSKKMHLNPFPCYSFPPCCVFYANRHNFTQGLAWITWFLIWLISHTQTHIHTQGPVDWYMHNIYTGTTCYKHTTAIYVIPYEQLKLSIIYFTHGSTNSFAFQKFLTKMSYTYWLDWISRSPFCEEKRILIKTVKISKIYISTHH